jgi:cytoskeletal protein CcmA (bactofilin family)
MAEKEDDKVIVFDKTANFDGFLKFERTVCLQGKFHGTIEAAGALIVDKDAVVDADHIYVKSLFVYGTVNGHIKAEDQVDMFEGSSVRGDVEAVRLRIADGVLFEGQCNMAHVDTHIDIFDRPSEEIKAELQQEIPGTPVNAD